MCITNFGFWVRHNVPYIMNCTRPVPVFFWIRPMDNPQVRHQFPVLGTSQFAVMMSSLIARDQCKLFRPDEWYMPRLMTCRPSLPRQIYKSLLQQHLQTCCLSMSESPPIRRRKPLPTPPIISASPVRKTRRQLGLNCLFLDHQAQEEGSEELSDNSSDDGDEANLSYITDGSAPDASFDIYARGMSSQGGFPTPMHQQRFTGLGRVSVADNIQANLRASRAARQFERAAPTASPLRPYAAVAIVRGPTPSPNRILVPSTSPTTESHLSIIQRMMQIATQPAPVARVEGPIVRAPNRLRLRKPQVPSDTCQKETRKYKSNPNILYVTWYVTFP